MAVDYLGSNTGIMNRGGKIVKSVNAHLANASTTLPAELKAIVDKFEAADLTDQVANLYAAYLAMQNQEVGNRQQIAAVWDAILSDRVNVIDQLGLSATDLNTILPALIRDMIAQSQTVNASVVTIGSVTAAGTNIGNGTVILTKLLDGSTSPIAGAPSITQYAGLNSELAINETMTFICTADSGRNGTPEGGEQFAWSGGLQGPPFDWQAEGSGSGPVITVAQGNSLLTDGDFENWGGTGNNTPSNWDILAGTTAGTHLFRESTIFHRGTYALKLTGDGSTATIGVSQTPPSGQIRARKCYAVVLFMRASSVPAAGTFECLFTGTGYSAGATEKVSVAFGSMTTSYAVKSFFISTPAIIPSDWKLLVRVTGTLSNTVSVYVDSLALVEVPYHGGLGGIISAGSTRFAVGDKFTVPITNTEGVIQKFWRQKYGVQLPSDNTSGETIADSLAT